MYAANWHTSFHGAPEMDVLNKYYGNSCGMKNIKSQEYAVPFAMGICVCVRLWTEVHFGDDHIDMWPKYAKCVRQLFYG